MSPLTAEVLMRKPTGGRARPGSGRVWVRVCVGGGEGGEGAYMLQLLNMQQELFVVGLISLNDLG